MIVRLFIALELDNDIKDKIDKIQNDLSQLGVKGNFTRKENLHITLAFIGDCDINTANKIVQVLDKIDNKSFDMIFENFDFFGEILYLDVLNNNEFKQLAYKIRTELNQNNICFDKKPTKAHITLVRKISLPYNLDIKKYGKDISIQAKNVSSVVLYESTRNNGILQYVKKYEKRLK